MENKSKRKIGKKSCLVMLGIALLCVAVVCIVLFLIQGETTITSVYDGERATERLVCESNITAYPLFNYDHSDKKSMKINAIFDNNDLNSISLIYKLYYNDKEEISQSESENHASLNLASQGDGLGPDAYNATYSKLKDGLQLSMYADKGDIDKKALRYFMLEDLSGTPYTQEKIAKIYSSKGLKCEITK